MQERDSYETLPLINSNARNIIKNLQTGLVHSAILQDPDRPRSQGYPPLWLVRLLLGPGHHLDAVDDWTHAQTQSAARAVAGHSRQVRLGVEHDRLVARVVADHIALATIDAHVLIDDGHHLILVVQLSVRANGGHCLSNHVLQRLGEGEKANERENKV